MSKARYTKHDQQIIDYVSHEIKTSLHSLIAMSEGLYKNWDSIDEQVKRTYIFDILKSSKRFNLISQELLDEYIDSIKNSLCCTKQNVKALSAKNILIIDDEESCLKSVELILMGSNFNIIQMSSGQAGINYLISNPGNIDVILLDIMMPGMSGLEVLTILKSNPQLSSIPVILQTACSTEYIDNGLKLGADLCVRKPYNKTILLEAIGSAFKNIN